MNSIDYYQLGLLMRVLRLRAALEQETLARQCGVSQSTVSRWEAGSARPSLAQAREWVEACAGSACASRAEGDWLQGEGSRFKVQGSGRAVQSDPALGEARAAILAYVGALEPDREKVPGSRFMGRESRYLELAGLNSQGEVERQNELAKETPTVAPLEPLTLNLEPLEARLRAALLSLVRTAPEVYDTQVPYFADVAAGLGEAQMQRSTPRRQLSVPREVYEADPTCYALRVSGDSMAPQLADGDIVIVSPAAELFDGCIVATYVEPDGDVVKVLRQLPGGAILLQPLNPAYPAIVLAPDDEREARIWGRVVLQQREL